MRLISALFLAGVLAVSHAISPAQLGWKRAKSANPHQLVEMVVAVKQQNVHLLDSLLMAVSDPDSRAYGKHLTQKQVHDLLAPSAESVEKVISFLESHGVPKEAIRHSPNSDFLVVDVPVRMLQRITGAQYSTYVHQELKMQVTRTENSLNIPSNVQAHIDFISPASSFPTHRPALYATGGGFGVTPDSIRQLYGIDNSTKFGHSNKNRQACAQFLGQYYSPTDLQTFVNDFNKDSPFNISTIEVFGPNTPTSPGIEAELDIQYLTAIGNNISTQFWSTAGQQPGNPDNEPFLTWLYNLGNMTDDKIPYVMSVSYGDNEDSVNFDYATRVNVEFQKAGLRGISLIFASGDGGVAGGQSTSCTKFIPTYPAGSPYVTAVGGTSGTPETSASFSSGGFSNYWDRPSYQVDKVKGYFASGVSGIPDSSLYNQTGAAIPDVSAQSNGFWIVSSGIPFPGASGTSAAAPTFAGIVSLLNDARLMAGKSPLGFLNPFLYKHADAFNDITSGNNPGCSTNGFPAAAGWDPVTGLGTPNFPKLLEAVKALP